MSPEPDSRSGDTQAKRKPYNPPQVVAVDLRAEEVLAIGCKAPTFGVASGNPCVVASCAAVGS
jgi:hypothetical protein